MMRTKGQTERVDRPILDAIEAEAAIVKGIEAERFMVHQCRRKQLRRLCDFVGSRRNYTDAILWFLDEGALYDDGVEFSPGDMADDLACSERTIQRAVEFWRHGGILAVEDREDDHGGSLPPRAKLLWGSVLEQLAGEPRGSVRRARSAEGMGGRRPNSTGAGPLGDRGPTIGGHECTTSADEPPYHSGLPSATGQNGECGGGDRIEGGGDRKPLGGDTKSVTPGVTKSFCHPPPKSEPLLERALRDPYKLLAQAATRASADSADDDDDEEYLHHHQLTRETAVHAGEAIWGRKFFEQRGRDGKPPAEVVAAVRALLASAWLAETCFSRTWLVRTAEDVGSAMRGPDQFRPKNPVNYLATALRRAAYRRENVGPFADDRESRSWFSDLMDEGERATIRLLASFPPAAPPQEASAPGPAAKPTEADRREWEEQLAAAPAGSPAAAAYARIQAGRSRAK
jgi:hypothetical protein